MPKAPKNISFDKNLNSNFYLDVLKNLNKGVWVVDVNSKILYANNALANILKTSVSDIIGKDKSFFINYLNRRLLNKSVNNSLECELFLSDGSKIYAIEYVSYLPNESVIGVISLVADQSCVTNFNKLKKSEELVKNSEIKYRTLFNNMTSSLSIYKTYDNGKSFVLFDINDATEKFEHIKRREILGKSISEIFSPETYDKLFPIVNFVYKNGKSKPIPIFYCNNELSSGWREGYVYKIQNDEIVIVLRDVSERKKIEIQAEQKSKEFNVLYKIYSSIKINIPLPDALKRITKDIVYGFTYPELIQTKINFDNRTYSYPSTQKKSLYKIKYPLVVSGIQRGFIEVGYTKRNINMITEAFIDEEKKLIRTVSNILGEHIVSRENIENYEKIVSKSITGLFITTYGVIRYVNPRFCKLFNVKKSDALDRRVNKFILDGEAIREKCLNSKKADFNYFTKGIKSDNSTLDLSLVLQKIEYHGVPGFLWRAHDITKLKSAEKKLKNFNKELQQKISEKTIHLEEANLRLKSLNEKKDEFLAVASHELRSPLTSIRGYLSFLADNDNLSQIPENIQKFVIRAYQNSESLTYLVNNILDATRLDLGRFELQFKKIDIIYLIKSIIDSLHFQLSEKKLEMEFNNFTARNQLFLKIDQIRISQVLRNLLDNAIKFSPKGKKLSIELSRSSKLLTIKIIDSGLGIPKNQISGIFDKFIQVKSSKTKYMGGAGLGLYIVKNIIELHGGTITVESKIKQGTTFIINLPI